MNRGSVSRQGNSHGVIPELVSRCIFPVSEEAAERNPVAE